MSPQAEILGYLIAREPICDWEVDPISCDTSREVIYFFTTIHCSVIKNNSGDRWSHSMRVDTWEGVMAAAVLLPHRLRVCVTREADNVSAMSEEVSKFTS